MQPNEHGRIVTYYGSWGVKDKKPKLGVYYFMMNEHIKKMVEKQKGSFLKQLDENMIAFKNDQKNISKKVLHECQVIKNMITELKKFVGKVIELNDLQMPKEERGKRVKVKKEVEAEEEDDFIF